MPTSDDYAEILRLHRKYRERDGDPLWKVFVRIGQELDRSGKKERCPACGHTNLVYSRLVDPKCADPWHSDDHLRKVASRLLRFSFRGENSLVVED